MIEDVATDSTQGPAGLSNNTGMCTAYLHRNLSLRNLHGHPLARKLYGLYANIIHEAYPTNPSNPTYSSIPTNFHIQERMPLRRWGLGR
jgi:hypothetical protein